ncbi:uncharacterized protein BDV17DRAFT_26759 [Aspergillus undulatus]|uniref:uncharacterized protein n=1 Tax=Aspergillus undulatus TaxID=1810928 RepID=UPI003CCD7FB8
MPGKQLSRPCMDCKDAESILTVRRRSLCRDCYIRFLGYKVFKRMEKYRLRRDLPRRGPCPVLLPLSYGVSSSVLLHMVHAQVEQLLVKPHAQAFELQVLIVDPSSISPSNPPHDEAFELLQQQFPRASITRLPLHSIFEYVPGLDEIMVRYAGQGFADDSTQSPEARLKAFRASITSATSISDVDSILLNRLIVAFAKSKGCLGVIWGDSDDRLAAKTLANVSVGRGSSLTWQVSDGTSPFGLEFNFPLRDLFKAELQDYANLFPELVNVIIPDAPLSDNVLTKNLSIDQLMIRYVATHGAKYPGVMSNVTRTANKLEASRLPTNGSRCALCSTYICNPEGASTQSTAETNSSNVFCYACERSRPELS